jgi:RimK family alpha-L-glutamate ligase
MVKSQSSTEHTYEPNTSKSIDFVIQKRNIQLPDFIITRPRGDCNINHYTAVLKQFENMGVYTVNKANNILKVKNKFNLHQILFNNDILTPKTMLVKFPISKDVIEKEIGFPLLLKPVYGSKSHGICLCKSINELSNILELIYCYFSQNIDLILQEFIELKDVSIIKVIVVYGKVISCMKQTITNDFKVDKRRCGFNAYEFELTNYIEELSLKVSKITGLGIFGIDIIITNDNQHIICDVNAFPGFNIDSIDYVLNSIIDNIIKELYKN